MKCPNCKKDNDEVVDSRAADGGYAIRRRRKCLACGRRYTTYEKRDELPLRVVKKDGSYQPFDRRKLFSGLLKACEKRPVSTDKIEEVVASIERALHDKYDREVPSKQVGELVMKELKKLDQVAYVRFASVYREFKDLSEFMDELKPMLKK
ncbi:MAG: transcriptional repressor NrdR [Planctomycetes bacterium]|nr:transcriptional repressor NrdR [Planctomycetota bacterium]